MEARIAFATLLRRFPRLRLTGERSDLSWSRGDGLVLRGLDALPVILSTMTSTDDPGTRAVAGAPPSRDAALAQAMDLGSDPDHVVAVLGLLGEGRAAVCADHVAGIHAPWSP